jgi:hypothetical protein
MCQKRRKNSLSGGFGAHATRTKPQGTDVPVHPCRARYPGLVRGESTFPRSPVAKPLQFPIPTQCFKLPAPHATSNAQAMHLSAAGEERVPHLWPVSGADRSSGRILSVWRNFVKTLATARDIIHS